MNVATTQYWLEMDSLGEVLIDVTYDFTPGQPAKLSGPPEDCYPEEGAVIDVTKVVTSKEGIDLTKLLASALNDYEPFLDHVMEAESCAE
jgi:hypothetical protein